MFYTFPQSNPPLEQTLTSFLNEKRTSHKKLPWLLTNSVMTADGTMAFSETSKKISGSLDREVLKRYRDASDAILVGANTVRLENYRIPSRSSRTGTRPRLTIVSRNLEFSKNSSLFSDSTYRPIIITTNTADIPEWLQTTSEIITTGETNVDFKAALTALKNRGLEIILSEGGPTINRQLIHADLIDEWNLTVSPLLTGLGTNISKEETTTPSSLFPEPLKMYTKKIYFEENFLFCRWLRTTSIAEQ